MTDQTAVASLDDILDGTLDDIADLPSFAAWPAGAYRVLLPVGFLQKVINEKPAFELRMKCEEVLELNNAAEQEEAPKVGDESSIAFMMDNDTGKGFFKEAIKPIIEHLGLGKEAKGAARAAVDSSKGMSCLVVLGRTKKVDNGETKFYPKLTKLAVL